MSCKLYVANKYALIHFAFSLSPSFVAAPSRPWRLVRVKTHPHSDGLANFTTKLAPVYAGPYCITQKLSEVNYRLTDMNTGSDAGVFCVVNLLPFRTWDPLVEQETVPADGSATEAIANSSLLAEMPEEASSGPSNMDLTNF